MTSLYDWADEPEAIVDDVLEDYPYCGYFWTIGMGGVVLLFAAWCAAVAWTFLTVAHA